MNRFVRTIITLAALVFASVPTAYAEDMWVQIRDSVVRSQPVFYSSAVSNVRYGDAVTKISESGGWLKVKFKGKEGYIPLSAVTESHVLLSDRGITKVLADNSDVVLAGKGFSKEVEEEYKRSESTARFDLVDRAEMQCHANTQEVIAFMKSGGLKG